MIKFVFFFIEMYMVGRRTPHTSFYLNKLKIHIEKRGERRGAGGAMKIQ
jgi:hypothetical protein